MDHVVKGRTTRRNRPPKDRFLFFFCFFLYLKPLEGRPASALKSSGRRPAISHTSDYFSSLFRQDLTYLLPFTLRTFYSFLQDFLIIYLLITLSSLSLIYLLILNYYYNFSLPTRQIFVIAPPFSSLHPQPFIFNAPPFDLFPFYTHQRCQTNLP